MKLSGMGLVVTAHSSQASASTQSELNLLLSGIKIAERQEEKNMWKTHFRLQKEKTRSYWCLHRAGRDKAFYTEGHETINA